MREKPKMTVPAKRVAALPSNGDSLIALINKAATNPKFDVEKFDRLVRLRREIEQEEHNRTANVEFNAALSRVQARVTQVIKDADNPQTRSRYASYAALDRMIRPIYTDEGFNLSYDEGDGAPANHMRVICIVARGDISRTYHVDVPIVTTGPKGTDFMTLTHAKLSADTYGKRRLLSNIFNLTAIDRDDDGNIAGGPRDTIDEQQLTKLQLLISDVGGKRFKELEKWLLDRAKIASLDELPARYYNSALRLIEQERKNYKDK